MVISSSTRLSAWIIAHRCRQRQHPLSRRTTKGKKFCLQKCRDRKKGEQVTINQEGNLDSDHVISKDDDITDSDHVLGDDSGVVNKVICEIISRLPVRSLMRFKCVCKPWQFLVQNDPYFIDLHRTNSNARPNLFFVVMIPLENRRTFLPFGVTQILRGSSFVKAVLVTANFEGGGRNVVNINNMREVDFPVFSEVLGPLHGLICIYNSQYYLGVRITNICTQVTTPWLKSALVRKHENRKEIYAEKTNCQLGFDHATRKHKVICIWNIRYRQDDHRPNGIFCEVLTIGEHEWRTIVGVPSNVVPDFGLIGSSVHINGSIYYSTLNFMSSGEPDNDEIVIFDVGLEKFRSIAVPSFITKHSQDFYKAFDYVKLLDIDGHLAVLCRINNHLVKLWLYGDDVGDDCSENCWRESTIELPFVWDKEHHLTFHPVAGQNEIIIKSHEYFVEGPLGPRSLSYFVYNWRKRTFTPMEINGIPSESRHMFNRAYFDNIFTDSLLPVQ